ncbi:MAG: PRC-barrel domain-containing protein [Hoeflea sp.]|uniref:PRC-barrel domain-containing protein n=1 Tax=Hoeflea sp. TaxID=1940281 RepID=UPI001DDC0C66|nr:PRC-barrel domain-containing protein [Hoeflea sp.]MBU4529222.1 PRC-barrel domain-containing protein [Alphaproteobacteria bacterium]MBU4543626.1 PRC-barrel domain-containing protein [Alphaproteobacteria bacterium]MBU4549252.1 PRC-barrel domain-containing protein [Alphaproteobacteria bacterium]MBV1725385.1 PRC-barrel domain-containing protein [Hoeflea sp.]MBV1785348.1 PRC-barrel domain-containing protein [Hoeflea sp.]
MFKMLLASTALTALVTTSAFAQTAPATPDTNAATTTTETSPTATADATGAMHGATLASDLIGANVYESSAQDAASIGEINDIVVSPEGEVSSVIVGVGGFLGIGEKDVEVEYSTIEWADRDGQRWIVANMTREQLEAAPAFDRTNIYTEAQSQPEGMDANQNMTATDNNMAPGTDTTMAPGTDQTAGQTTAERVQDGTSAVAPAEEQAQVIDRMTMTEVGTGDYTADDLTGRTVYGANDENIGEVGDVLISADNQIEGFVINVGGFLGMGEKEVAVSPENLDIRADADGGLIVFTPFTKEQLEAQPEYSEETWASDRDSVIMMAPVR